MKLLGVGYEERALTTYHWVAFNCSLGGAHALVAAVGPVGHRGALETASKAVAARWALTKTELLVAPPVRARAGARLRAVGPIIALGRSGWSHSFVAWRAKS